MVAVVVIGRVAVGTGVAGSDVASVVGVGAKHSLGVSKLFRMKVRTPTENTAP